MNRLNIDDEFTTLRIEKTICANCLNCHDRYQEGEKRYIRNPSKDRYYCSAFPLVTDFVDGSIRMPLCKIYNDGNCPKFAPKGVR